MRQNNRRPTPPGQILQLHYLEPRAITIAAFAAAIGVSRKHMSGIVNGRARLEPALAARIAKVLRTTTEFWINLQAAIDAFDADRAAKRWKPTTIFARPARGASHSIG